MPFREFKSSFQPSELEILTASFNEALQQLLVANGHATPESIELLRKKLAEHILASATERPLDSTKLTASALAALTKGA